MDASHGPTMSMLSFDSASQCNKPLDFAMQRIIQCQERYVEALELLESLKRAMREKWNYCKGPLRGALYGETMYKNGGGSHEMAF